MRAPLALAAAFVLAGCASAGGGTADPQVGKAAPRSLSGITPPHLTVTHRAASDVAPGFVFVGEKGGKDRPSGPVIADNEGRVVWYHEVPHGLEVTDFRAQTYNGKPVLTWWQGTISKAGVGRGNYVVYDDRYHQLAQLKAAHGLDGDLHEFQLTPRGSAYITVYHEVRLWAADGSCSWRWWPCWPRRPRSPPSRAATTPRRRSRRLLRHHRRSVTAQT